MGAKPSKDTGFRGPENEPDLEGQVEDISKIFYEIPRKKDMAICFVYFNPTGTKRMLMNYLYTVEKLKLAKIPHYTLELYYTFPEIQDAIHIKGTSVLFHKERLCRILERSVPFWYSKLLFLDADIIFSNRRWYAETSDLLNKYDVVQPFSKATWLDITYKQCIQERVSVAYMDRKKPYESRFHHPGFGWAFKRSWYRRIGFFEYGITGSGDTLSAAAWLGTPFGAKYLKEALKPAYAEYLKNPQPKLSCTIGSVYHLWHGTKQNRKYVERHAILDGILDIRSILKEDREIFELLNSELEKKMLDYFISRDDDGF